MASEVTGSQILFGSIQAGLMDFLRSSLTDGGSAGRGGAFEANALLLLEYLSHY